MDTMEVSTTATWSFGEALMMDEEIDRFAMPYGDPARCIIASLIKNIQQAASNKHAAPSLSKAETKVLDTADRQWEKHCYWPFGDLNT